MTEDRVPAAPIRRLIEQWEERHPDIRLLAGAKAAGCLFGNPRIIAELTGCTVDCIKDIRGGRTESLPFDRADRIVTRLSEYGGMGWHQDAELARVYQEIDLCAVDAALPTTRLVA